jgi:hypothetical protein
MDPLTALAHSQLVKEYSPDVEGCTIHKATACSFNTIKEIIKFSAEQ